MEHFEEYDDADEAPRSMTRAQWAAVICLGAFAGVPLLSMLVGNRQRSSGLGGPALLGLVAFFVLVAVVFAVVRSAIRARVGAPTEWDDPWD